MGDSWKSGPYSPCSTSAIVLVDGIDALGVVVVFYGGMVGAVGVRAWADLCSLSYTRAMNAVRWFQTGDEHM